MVEAGLTSVADYHYISYEKNEAYNSEAGLTSVEDYHYILHGENESYNGGGSPDKCRRLPLHFIRKKMNPIIVRRA